MTFCKRAQELFGAFWDDEISRAEREWLESHFAACEGCRRQYEAYSRTLELVGGLPRHEASEDLLERVLARTKQAAPAPDVIGPRRVYANDRPVWVPVAAAAALVLLTFAAVSPWLARRGSVAGGEVAVSGGEAARVPVVQPRLVSVPAPAPAPARSAQRTPAAANAASAPVAMLGDSLFDHSEDVEFILDPVTLHRGRARTVSRLPQGVQGEQAVITF